MRHLTPDEKVRLDICYMGKFEDLRCSNTSFEFLRIHLTSRKVWFAVLLKTLLNMSKQLCKKNGKCSVEHLAEPEMN